MSEPRHLAARITDAGHPGRTDAVLQRERELYRAAVADVLEAAGSEGGGPLVDGPPVDDPELTMDQLEPVLAAGRATSMPSAAFVAGRCEPADPADAATLDRLLEAHVAAADPEDLGSGAQAFVQAAMALVLRGRGDAGHRALRSAVADGPRSGSMAEALAIAYLAQLGDLSGWSRLRDLLRSEDGYGRLMAARHLRAFQPWDGTRVDGQDVRLADALASLADDPDPLVAQEVPVLLVQLAPPDVVARLERLAASGAHAETREVARQMLEVVAAGS